MAMGKRNGARFLGPSGARVMLAAPLLLLAAGHAALAADATGEVVVRDTGSQVAPATFECQSGHKRELRQITLDTGAVRYTFRYCGCQDPSHGDLHPAAEGNFGMPDPVACNWYWGGFLFVSVNGKDATQYTVREMRVTEKGARGAFQIVWAHPDADVGLRMLTFPGANHMLALLTWKPRAEGSVKSLAVRLVCYPSFFTSSRQRQGDRHCQTPRAEQREPKTLELVPEKDTYLYYYDTVFDKAKGEGAGPCAALVAPEGVKGGRVQIGGYAVVTLLDLKPEAGQARLAFYDFAGKTNAEAEGYLKAHAAEDLARLAGADFRPQLVAQLQVPRLKDEATRLLTQATDDGKPYQAKVNAFLKRVEELQAKADQGDWRAEADLSQALSDSEDLFWKLKIAAVLNRP